MTDHLEAARDRLGGLHDHLSRREVALAADDLHAILSAILDHLDAQVAASIRRGLADAAAGRFTDDEPEPEPDYGPRPAGCCGTCPPTLGGGYDCTCADNPRCDANHTDRIDRYGSRWFWCDRCEGFRPYFHGIHRPARGCSAAELDRDYGPLTFASRPANTPTTAPQPDEAHGDAPDPARPADTHTDNIRAEAWDEGHRTGYADGVHPDGDHTTPNPYRKDRA